MFFSENRSLKELKERNKGIINSRINKKNMEFVDLFSQKSPILRQSHLFPPLLL